MLELKDACGILGVKENATRDEVAKRYNILLKKHKIALQNGGETPGNFDEVTRAYRLLMGYGSADEEKIKEEQNKPSNNPLLRKFNLNEKQLRNFVYYYKFHFIIGLIALVLLVISVESFVNRVVPDFNVAFIGEYSYPETETKPLEKAIKDNIPQIKEPSLTVVTVSDKLDGQQGYAMQMKAVTLMAAGELDVVIVDRPNFENYAEKGAFIRLDDLKKELGEKDGWRSLKAENDDMEHIYGFDAAGSSLVPKSHYSAKELIIAVRSTTKNKEKAMALIRLLAAK